MFCRILNIKPVVSIITVTLFLISCSGNRSGHLKQDMKIHYVSEKRQTNGVDGLHKGMVLIKGGTFLMGSNQEKSVEAPVHKVRVHSFWMDRYQVTVAQFRKFVEATHYVTDAEKYGWSVIFDLHIGNWRAVTGADWRHPDGPGSIAKANEPVTQVSWNDAMAYARWAGKRLPTEAEWEYAARGGLVQKKFVWGDTLQPGRRILANYWQGSFPQKNTVADGYLRRSPVGQFPPNRFGLYDMCGNVWEWVSDWYDGHYYHYSPEDNPMGPSSGSEKVLRGGSWRCSKVCGGFYVATRMHATPDSGLNNVGFRLAEDVE